MSRAIHIDPHHPDCSYPHGPAQHAGLDPRVCCYCAALVRRDLSIQESPNEDPLDFRYGGPRCGCKPQPTSVY